MTYEEMVRYLQETYSPGDYTGDELMNNITAEINAMEARGEITAEVRDRLYRYFGVHHTGARRPRLTAYHVPAHTRLRASPPSHAAARHRVKPTAWPDPRV